MQKNLQEILKNIFEEYQSSNMPIDDFIRLQLTNNGFKDADEIVMKINRTLSDIDDKYASLQNAKSNGNNREEWLRQEMDSVSENINSNDMGKIISSTTNVLNGVDATPDESANYDALDAVTMIKDIDDALIHNVTKSLAEETK